MSGRRSGVSTQVVRTGDLIPDNRLLRDEADLLEHEAIAKGVAEIALTATTPVNIALFGAWGSGKSSIYTMVEKHLADITSGKVKVARYDAWKYGGKELKRNFVDSLARDLHLDKDPDFSTGLDRAERDTRLDLWRWFKRNWRSLLLGFAFAIVVGALWVVGISTATKLFTDDGFKLTAKALIPQVGTVFGLALLAALLGPKALEGAAVTTETPAPEGADQFAKRFGKLVKAARKGSHHPLVVFIDELDRCSPSDVVATLRDLKTFLDQPNCAFVVAADREVIVRALREEVPQAKPVREEEPYYATPGAFLDKIFQHQIALPPLRARALTEFARALADAQGGGVWAEMRAMGDDCYDRAIFALVPVHVRSPRRVKVLLNNFATNARIADSRGISWLDRVHEIAVLTVLQTEFPTVVGDLRRVPRLLTYIRGEETPASTEVSEIVRKYADPGVAIPAADAGSDADEPNETVSSDELITDDDSAKGLRAQQNASNTLRRQLNSYLGKVAAAGLQDPRPDLLYLKPAADRERLPDPKLGDAIDFATDTAPFEVVEAFSGQESATLAIAIPLLVIEGDNAVGLGRQFAYESACLLVEQLDPDHFQYVAAQTHPSLLAALRSGSLSKNSKPGALLVAAWAGSHEAVHDFFSGAGPEELTVDLLGRFTRLLPHAEKVDAALIVELLAERFDVAPEPLLIALAEVPVQTACDLWAGVARTVIDAVNELELPTPEPSEEPPAQPATRQPGRPLPAQPATSAEPEPTGEGVALLERLVETALSRTDGEPLVSAIFASFQIRPAKTPMVQWTLRSADRVVAPMDSPLRRARHALLGIRAFQSGAWSRWATLLQPPPVDSVDASVGELAVTVISQDLLPAFVPAKPSPPPAELAELTKRVAGWSSLTDGELAKAAQSVLGKMAWADADPDPADETSREVLWASKQALYGVLLALADDATADGEVASLVVDDLVAVLGAYTVDDTVVTQFAETCGHLPSPLCLVISERLDAYEVRGGEEASVLEIRLLVKGRSGGQPVAASELLELEESERSTAISSAWLALKPAAEDVVKLLGSHPLTPEALGRFADQLTLDARTMLWVEGEKAEVSSALLRAAGRAGVGSEAVDHCRLAISNLTREPDRSEKVGKLRLARPTAETTLATAAVRRAAAEMAQELLQRDVAGDVRSAAELMCWAGGTPSRAKTELRELFDTQVKKHKGALTKTIFDQLQETGLLTKRKSFWNKVGDALGGND